jgi:hypothetical protein
MEHRMTGYLSSSGTQYRLPQAALESWAAERLQFNAPAAGRLQAVFSYACTTCRDGGVDYPVRFVVELSGSRSDPRLVSLQAEPEAGDKGHRQLCNPDDHMFSAGTPASIGLPDDRLASVMRWRPDVDVGGCTCSRAHRAHKWRNVLEVLHYAVFSRTR